MDVGNARVLLVEDNHSDALLIRELLTPVAPALELVWVQTLADATELLARESVTCVLLDLGLPDAIGLGAIEELRHHAVAIVVLTGHDDEQRGLESLSAGAQDYLVKGQVSGSLLLRSIRYAIERTQAAIGARELLERRLQAQENTRLARGLLPTTVIHDPQVRVAATYHAGSSRALLGGDFYDVVELADGSVLALIGDVCGHGPDEAALGVSLRVAWRALVLAERPDQEVLEVLEQVIEHERQAELIYATLALIRLQPDRQAARVYLAGHPPPVLLGAKRPVSVDPGIRRAPLGLAAPAPWLSQTVDLSQASALLLYTDGLIEGKIGMGPTRLGTEGLVELLKDVPSRTNDAGFGDNLLASLVADAQRLNGGDLTDDLAAVLLSWR